MMGCCLFVYYRKKRKQASRNADDLSLCSLDINEPSTKRSKSVSRVRSLASLLPPVKSSQLKRIGQTLQRSVAFRSNSRTDGAPLPPPPPPPPPTLMTKTSVVTSTVNHASSTLTASYVFMATAAASKRRDSKLWSETFNVHLGAAQPLTSKEIKRQEAIFELTQGERDLVEDLRLAKKAYHDPMLTLSIMTKQELNQIFGTLDSLIPLHEDLLSRLREARRADGSTEHVGHILSDWLPCLSAYTPYCSNQVKAKALLDQKKQDRRVQDFLQRCLQSPFSRKLDLWNFLDIPRSRLVKYPLLLREILKHTPCDHPDHQHLDEAVLMVQTVLADIDRRTGESECQFYKDRLVYSEDGHRDQLIEQSRTLSCHGDLRNNRGAKFHVFLFQDVLVITRSISLNDQPVSYQLCRHPIPTRELDLDDISDGEMRVGGSIRGAFSNNERTKNFFSVSYHTGGRLQSHCFQASDAFNKQQWINCIRQAKEAAALTQVDQSLETGHRLVSESGEMQMVLDMDGDTGLIEDKRLSLGEEAELSLNPGTVGEKETGPGLDGLAALDSDEETGRSLERGFFGKTVTACRMMDGERGGGGVVEGVHVLPTSHCSAAIYTNKEDQVMEEEQGGGGEEEEEAVPMDTSKLDSLQAEPETLRC
ncbi:rho guanine nucleotide exchange factor 3 isoform X2 [Thalassophryne amazonica]|uniref:rho guanine nucleotide exchange factor 3 isoform X2 n=1 Tax=Thalassophryne amazonica TaxID=390379 RepID=UPI0014716F4B|nr:rho guanine nucleotide exchange factor 3 isoform X2 [Thalassophryne amazonica]